MYGKLYETISDEHCLFTDGAIGLRADSTPGPWNQHASCRFDKTFSCSSADCSNGNRPSGANYADPTVGHSRRGADEDGYQSRHIYIYAYTNPQCYT